MSNIQKNLKQQQRQQENHPYFVEFLAAAGFADQQVKDFENQFGMLPRGGKGHKGSTNDR